MSKTFIKDLEERLINNSEDWKAVDDKLSEKTYLTPPVYMGGIMKENEEHEQLYIIRIALKTIPYYQKESKSYREQISQLRDKPIAQSKIKKQTLSQALLQATLADNWQEELEKVWLENK